GAILGTGDEPVGVVGDADRVAPGGVLTSEDRAFGQFGQGGGQAGGPSEGWVGEDDGKAVAVGLAAGGGDVVGPEADGGVGEEGAVFLGFNGGRRRRACLVGLELDAVPPGLVNEGRPVGLELLDLVLQRFLHAGGCVGLVGAILLLFD